jgi:hypothetical protein
LRKNLLADSQTEKQAPPPPEIFTSRKHMVDYFTTDGVTIRTGYKNKRDWYLLPIREILDNDVDFLWKYYKGSDKASIKVDIKMDDKLFQLKIRNTNDSNISIFPNLTAIFDYEMRYGSKQDVHIITRGMLGDAMKQILSLGYVLHHAGDDGTSFADKQWDYPLIIRHNKKEWAINLNYSKAQQEAIVKAKPRNEVDYTDTEIELTLPVIDEVRNDLTRDYIEEFCRKYILFTTDISFNFTITDDINHVQTQEQDSDIATAIIDKLSKGSPKGILHVDVPALHPISLEKDWSNTDSVHSYTPEEFMRRIQNVHDKSLPVYDVLFNFREGNRIKKTYENQISISELISSEDRDKKMQQLFEQLKNVLNPPSELSLPYTTNTRKRKEALYSRIAQSKFYDIDTEKESSYKLVRGFYTDSIVQYPFAFEILAIPLKNPINVEGYQEKQTKFIGAINYSVSPQDNYFDGEYRWHSDKTMYKHIENNAKDVRDILRLYHFSEKGDNYVKLPCIIIANLVTPRRDPLGHDKSKIDTVPFARTIIDAVEKMASAIQTYRAAGFRWRALTDEPGRGKYRGITGKISGKEALRQWLVSERGLRDKYPQRRRLL